MTASNKGQENRIYSSAEIKKICQDAGADDVGLVDLDRESLCKEREGILHVYLLLEASFQSLLPTTARTSESGSLCGQ